MTGHWPFYSGWMPDWLDEFPHTSVTLGGGRGERKEYTKKPEKWLLPSRKDEIRILLVIQPVFSPLSALSHVGRLRFPCMYRDLDDSRSQPSYYVCPKLVPPST